MREMRRIKNRWKREREWERNKVTHGEHYLYTEEFLEALDANLKVALA